MKLCLVVDRDLTTGQKVAQLVHGMRAWSEEHPELDGHWFRNSNTVVCLEGEVEKIHSKLQNLNVPHALFREPDLENKLTCLVFLQNEVTKKISKGLPLVG